MQSQAHWGFDILSSIPIKSPDLLNDEVWLNMDTPAVFKSRQGLGLLHLNVWSMMSKMDFIDIWMHDTNTDILALSDLVKLFDDG